MRYKKTLLVAFFLSLFVLQQTQVSARFSANNKDGLQPSIIHTSGIPTQLYITVVHLDEFNYPRYENGNIVKCYAGDPFWSCGEGGSGYPYGNENPVLISMEDYLLDVLPREMDVKNNAHTLASLQAQALAARSYADFRLRYFGEMDNSTTFQVFIPNAYELYDPSATALIGNAVSSTSGQYLSYGNEAIDAQFASDSILRTATCLNADYTQCHPYLIKVSDPISDWQLSEPACNAINNGNSKLDDPSTEWDDFGKVWGMSQKGAIRWSVGNHCANPTAGNLPWPVKWDDYRQILVHYYTGIDILNGSGTRVAPDDRWNLLWHNNFESIGVKPELQSDQSSTLKIRFQNTSVNLWTANSLEIGYRWYQNGQPIPSDPNWHAVDGEHPEIPVGKEYPPLSPTLVEPLSVPIIAPSYEGDYTLHLDLRHKTPNQSVNDGWFSQQTPAWPDATIDVHVNGPTATPTFTPEPTVTPTATPVITAYFHGPVGPSCVGGGCASPTGYNNVMTPPTRNEQSMQANDPSAGLLGGGRVETKILVDGGGIGTLRMYYGLSGESCPAGNELQVSKVSGNVRYYNVPSTGYLDVNLAQVDGGGFILYTRCKTTTGYTGNYGIDSVWHSFVPDGQPPSTPQPPTCVKTCLYEKCTYTDGSTDREPARAKLASLSQGLMFTIRNFDRITDQAALLYRVRDEILDTSEEGQRYIDLYYAHSEEIAAILDAHSELADQGLDVVDTFVPGLQALLDGQGNTIVIISEQIQQAQAFLDALIPYASPELQQAIADERSRQPLEQMSGMALDQAWAFLNRFQLQPANWQFEYPSTTQNTFLVSETSGLASLDNVIFTASDLVQAGQPSNVIPSSAFGFTPNGFSIPANSSQVVTAFVELPQDTTLGIYTGSINVASGGMIKTIDVEVTVTSNDLLFADGFESGDLSAWDWADTGGGDLSVSAQAAAIGSYGMQAVIDDTSELAVYDELPVGESHYSARFYFDPNSVSLPSQSQSGFALMIADDISDYWLLCLYLDQVGEYYTLTLCGLDDTDTWLEGSPVFISDDWQAVEIEWQASSAPGANDGFIHLWVNDVLVDSLENLDNDTQSIADLYLGVMDAMNGTSGTVYFDSFESREGSYIGLDPNGPSLSPQPFVPDEIFADGFESGDLSAWSSATTDSGDLSVSAAAAHQSSYGLEALIDDRNGLRAIYTSPLDETHYRARFYFDPNSLVMVLGKAHYIFEGVNLATYDPILRTELFYESGAYKLRAQVMNDSWVYTSSSKYVISDDWHIIELEWQAASTPGANDGFLKLWVDDTLMGTISNIDNDTHTIGRVQLGATNGIDTGTSGSMYFDKFEARRNSYIGP